MSVCAVVGAGAAATGVCWDEAVRGQVPGGGHQWRGSGRTGRGDAAVGLGHQLQTAPDETDEGRHRLCDPVI